MKLHGQPTLTSMSMFAEKIATPGRYKLTCCQVSLDCSTLCRLYACSAQSASPADLAVAGATFLLAGACAGLGVLLSDTRLATPGTGGEAVRPGGAPKEASSCSRIFGLSPAGNCFLTALPTLECTYSTLPVFARICEVPHLVWIAGFVQTG